MVTRRQAERDGMWSPHKCCTFSLPEERTDDQYEAYESAIPPCWELVSVLKGRLLERWNHYA